MEGWGRWVPEEMGRSQGAEGGGGGDGRGQAPGRGSSPIEVFQQFEFSILKNFHTYRNIGRLTKNSHILFTQSLQICFINHLTIYRSLSSVFLSNLRVSCRHHALWPLNTLAFIP